MGDRQLQEQATDLAFSLLDQHKQDQEDMSATQAQARDATQQVEELRMQLQQLESRLGAAQLALRHSSSKSPAKSHQLTASLDAFSPSETRQSSQDKPAAKKMRTDTSPPLPSQTLTTQDTATAADITADINSVPMTQLPSIAASQGQTQAPDQEDVTDAIHDDNKEKPALGHKKVVARGTRGRGCARGRSATKIS